MGTRSLYKFIDKEGSFEVYKHWDGDCENSALFIKRALEYAWPLPRFEASDFSATFIAANKEKGGGDVYISNNEYGLYKFEIYENMGNIFVRAFVEEGDTYNKIFEGSLKDFEEFDEPSE